MQRNILPQHFYGTDAETFYVTGSGRVFVVQSPDLVCVCDQYELEALPKGSTLLHEGILGEEFFALAAKLDAATK